MVTEIDREWAQQLGKGERTFKPRRRQAANLTGSAIPVESFTCRGHHGKAQPLVVTRSVLRRRLNVKKSWESSLHRCLGLLSVFLHAHLYISMHVGVYVGA